MKQRIARIIGFAVFAPLATVAGVMAVYEGRARTGRLGGFREVQEASEPLLYLFFTIGYFVVSAFFFFMLWKEIVGLREWRRMQRGEHRLSGIIDQ
jgi:hypothetical protein